MTKQRIEIIVGAVIDCDRWLPNQQSNEQRLRGWAEMAVQDQIDTIQIIPTEGGYEESFVEIDYGEEL